MQVTLTSDELRQLHDRLFSFVSQADPDLARLVVTAAGGPVEWTATDAYRLARLPAGSADQDGTFAVPLRTATLVWQMCDRRDADCVVFSVDGRRGQARVDGVDLPFDAGLDGYPSVDEHLSASAESASTQVTVAAEDLFAVIHGANLRPPWLDTSAQETFVLQVDTPRGRLRAVAAWEGHPETSATVPCTATGDARVGVNPGFLFELAEAVGEDVLTLHLPPDASVPLRVESQDGLLALLMPVRLGVESARPAFEGMLAEFLGMDADDLERDGDGDYPILLPGDQLLYLRLTDGDPETGGPDKVDVFAILAADVDSTPELLTELNDLNRHVGFARLYWADRAVFVGDELLLSTLDAAELGHACRTVADLADRVAPMLRMVHGGS